MATIPKPISLKNGTVKFRIRFRTSKGANPLSKTFDTADGAQRFADLVDAVGGAAALQALDATVNADRGRTMQTAFDDMLESMRSNNTGWSIRVTETRSAHWLPTFGPYPVAAVTERMVSQWIQQRRNEPGRGGERIAKSTLQNELRTLKSVLRREVRRGTIRINPAEDAKIPSDMMRKHEPVFLSPEQLTALWSAMDDKWRLMVQVTSGTGLRWGEVTRLDVQSLKLDHEPPEVHVTRAWKRDENGVPRDGTPKSGKSRTVSLPHSLVAPLREYISANHLRGNDLLWCRDDGRPLIMACWWKTWDRAIKQSGIGVRPRFHDLRHSHASMLIAANVPMKVISERLGHSSIKITMDVYGHLQPDAAIKAAATVDQVMFGAPKALPAA